MEVIDIVHRRFPPERGGGGTDDEPGPVEVRGRHPPGDDSGRDSYSLVSKDIKSEDDKDPIPLCRV